MQLIDGVADIRENEASDMKKLAASIAALSLSFIAARNSKRVTRMRR